MEASNVFLNTYLLKQDLSIELRAHQLSTLAIQIILESYHFLPSKWPPCLPFFYMGSRDVKTTPHALLVSTMYFEPPPRSLSSVFDPHLNDWM